MPRFEYMVIEAAELDKEWLLEGNTALLKLLYASVVDKEEFEKDMDKFDKSVRRLKESMVVNNISTSRCF